MRIEVGSRSDGSQEGSIIVIVMMFMLVFLTIGSALFVLVRSSNTSTALERTDVKSFNVAEAGVDAALVGLRARWPRVDADPSVTVDEEEFRSLYADTKEFPNPSHGHFIRSLTYDNTSNDPTSVVANRLDYDSNHDDVMWIDSEADVGNDRHRILVLAERLKLPVGIKDVALVANKAGGNGQGLHVYKDPLYDGPMPKTAVVYAGYQPDFNKDIDREPDITLKTVSTNPFSEYVTPELLKLLRDTADKALPRSLFDDTSAGGAGPAATAFLLDETTGPGSVVYVDTNQTSLEIKVTGGANNRTMGTPDRPVILVLRAPNLTSAIYWGGDVPFYGVLIVEGNATLAGTVDVKGSVICSGGVENLGGAGGQRGIAYNGDYIRLVNELHTLSVALVPNTWEEYTVPQ